MVYDANFSNVSLLLKGDGASGSAAFVDSSANPKTPMVYGGVVHDTTEKKFGSASIGGFDGSGDALVLPYTPDLHLPGDFTIELWIHSSVRYGFILCAGGGSGIAWASYELIWQGGDINFAGSSANSGYDIGSESGSTGRIGYVQANTWTHVAVTCQGDTYRGFVGGVKGYEQTIAKHPFDPGTRGLAIGANFTSAWATGTPTNTMQGRLDEIRIKKGECLYTSDFTPPAAPFPEFVGGFSGRIKDSADAYTQARVRAYLESSGQFVGEALSDPSSGEFLIGTKHSGAHSLLFYPSAGDSALQMQAFNNVLPAL